MQTKITSALVLLLALLTTSVDVNAKIYKSVDAEGRVVFTDIPPKDDQQSVEVETYNTYTPATPIATPESEAEVEEPVEDVAPSYTSLRITAPSDDEPVRENAGNVTISVTSTPALDTSRGHTLQVLLDDVVMANGEGNSLSLTNVDRGTHSVIVQIVDAQGEIKITSEAVTFHMLRHSIRKQPRAAN